MAQPLVSQPSEESGFVKEIPSKAQHFADWYTAVVLKAELADYYPVRGCTVIRPASGVVERPADHRGGGAEPLGGAGQPVEHRAHTRKVNAIR